MEWRKGKTNGFTIRTYQSASKSFQKSHFVDFRVMHALASEPKYFSSVKDIFYNGYDSLFLMVETATGQLFHDRVSVFKFDLTTNSFYEGVMILVEQNKYKQWFHDFYPKFFGGKPTYLVTAHSICDLDDFDFEIVGNRAIPSTSIQYLNPDHWLHEVGILTKHLKETDWRHTLATPDEFYWIYPAYEPEFILKLDMENRRWETFCEFEEYAGYRYTHSFVLNGKIYLVGGEGEEKEKENEKPHVEILWVLEKETEDEYGSAREIYVKNEEQVPLFSASYRIPRHILESFSTF